MQEVIDQAYALLCGMDTNSARELLKQHATPPAQPEPEPEPEAEPEAE